MTGDPSAPASTGEVRRVLLGELLVQSKVITQEQLGEILSAPREHGKKLGQMLIERGWITEAQLTQTLSLQLSVPWVSLYHIDFSRQLLNRVARDLAELYCLIPIFVRHVKGQGETLYVAMDDPTNEIALSEVARLAALPARPMIASASDIRSAIRVYYGDPSPMPVIDVPAASAGMRPDPPTTTREGRARLPSQPPPAPPLRPRSPSQPPPAPPTMRRTPPSPPSDPTLIDASPPTTRSSPPPPSSQANLEAAAVIPEERKSRPDDSEPSRRRAKMLSLTLLDGTTIKLPSSKKPTGPDGLTARDFISALRATAHGADATEILGEQARWEPVIAALLSILLRKGLIADWEFVEELRKI